MLNIKELEKKWLRYKIKSLTPYLIIFISIPLIIVGIIVIISSVTNKKTKPSNRVIVQHKIVKEHTIKVKKNPVSIKKETIKVEKKSLQVVKLTPSLSFMKKIQNSAQLYDSSDYVKKVQNKKEIQKKELKQQIKPKPIVKAVVPKSKNIQIQTKNTRKDVQDVIKRFKKNNNPALSLFVAKKEYELANYNQAYNYALITNKLDNNIEESWLIFAKSLVKLGKKKQAIFTLKEYIKNSHSNNAQILLRKILSGKFI